MTPKRSPASPSEPSPTPLFDFAADSPESTPPSAPTQAPKRGRRPKATQETEPTPAPKRSRTAKKSPSRPTKKAAADATPQELPPNERPFAVPKNWLWTRLGDVARWGSGGTPSRKTPQYYDGSIPWIKSGELNDDYVFDSEEKITEEAIKKSSAKLYPPNTVVIAMYGATIGKTAILGVQATTNQACACAVCRDILDYRFLFDYARSQKDAFIKKGKGGAQPNISQEVIKPYPFPLPPLAEQERIVALVERLFARLDEAAEIVRETLDASEERRSALLRSAFSGALTAQWREKHGVGIETWRQTKLKAVCQVNPPKMKTQHLPDDLEASFFPMASLSEIEGAITEPQTRPLKEVRKGFTNFQEGDVVFAKITPCMENGKSAVVGPLVNGIGYGTTEFYVLRCSSALLNRYVYHLVRSKSFRDEAKAVMTGAVGQQRVPKSFLEEYPLNLPSVAEQAEIVRLLDAAFEKERRVCELAEETAARIETLKKAILARAFRGELGTNDPTDPKPFADAPST